MHQGVLVQHHGRRFVPLYPGELLKHTVQTCLLSLACVDLAWREGKALDSIDQRMAGLRGFTAMRVAPTTWEYPPRSVKVIMSVARTFLEIDKSVVQRTLDEANRRFGLRIEASIEPGSDRR